MGFWQTVLAVGVVAVIAVGAMALGVYALTSLLEDILTIRATKRLRERIRGSVINSQLPWEKLTRFWKDRSLLTQPQVTWQLKKLLEDAYSGEDDELMPHVALLEAYVERSEDEDPLAGLPEDVRITLETLVREKGVGYRDLRQLTEEIHLIVKKSESRRIRRSWVTWASFVVGVLGLAFAVFAYALPVASPSAVAPSNKDIEQNAKK